MSSYKYPKTDVTNAVGGPASAADNRIARWDGATGELLQNSTVSLSDAGVVSGMSIDADDNPITDLQVSSLKAGVLDTDLTSVAGTDTTIPSAKATKAAIDAEATARASADTTLQTNIDTEASTRASADTTLQTNINAKQDTVTGAATTIVSSNLTASKALISNASGKVAVSSVTDTELGYVGGVTSAIQTQLDAKEPTITNLPISKGGTNSTTALNNNRVMVSSSSKIQEAAAITASRALASDSNGIPTHATTTTTELNYLSGATSSIQNQLNALTSPLNQNNYSLSLTVGSSALTIALKDKAGSDPSASSPVSVAFRNSTLATGDYSVVNVTSALSITVPSTGTLGHQNSKADYVYVYLLNNAGAAELLVTSTLLHEDDVHTTTAVASSPNSISGKYSTTARTGVAVKYIGKCLSTQTTAGTWVLAAISEVSVGRPPKNSTAMSNAEATRFGLKLYSADLASGGNDITYNGAKATIALSAGGGSLSSVDLGNLIPYQMQDGSWRLRFNIKVTVSSTSRTALTLSINGITTVAYNQAIHCYVDSSATLTGRQNSGVSTNLITIEHSSASATAYGFSGDIALASKPTWAY